MIAETLSTWLPGAGYLELDCGHVTYAEQPPDFARAVAAFGSELMASASSAAQ